MVVNTPVDMVKAQLAAIYDDIPPRAVKTGMLSSAPIVEAVYDFLSDHTGIPLVVDPVMVATSGAVLLEKDAIEVYKKKLIPLSSVITPNIPEAEVLSGQAIRNLEDMKGAAEKLMALGPQAVLVKGGHLVEEAEDVLYDGRDFHLFKGERIETENTHGTGCTLSSAMAAELAKGHTLIEAVGLAKVYMTGPSAGPLPIPWAMATGRCTTSGFTETVGGKSNELSILRLHVEAEIYFPLGSS